MRRSLVSRGRHGESGHVEREWNTGDLESLLIEITTRCSRE